MHSYVRSRKSLMITISMVYIVILSVYLSYHFAQTLGHYSELPRAYSLVLANLLAFGLVGISFYTKKLILGFTIYLSALYALCDISGMLLGLNPALHAGAQGIYAGGSLPLALAAVISIVGYGLARYIRLKRYNLRLPGLAQPVRIALISDMHLGTNIKERDFPRIVDMINGIGADMVMLCGDIYEERTRPEQYEASLDAFAQIRADKYYVLGNHEYAAMRLGHMDMGSLQRDLASAGVKTLKDSSIEAFGMRIIGRDDPAQNRKELSKLAGEAGLPTVVVDHHPSDYANASALGIDLVLSGHSHGGQLFPVGRLGELFGHSELMYGHRAYGKTHAIVSAGIGTWGFPMRVGMPSEIAVVDLQPE